MESEIKTITIENKNYPSRLKEIASPPKILYFKGNMDAEGKPVIAIVGTRRCSAYGKQITEEITAELINNGFTVVSGLARGIDTVAHSACLDRKGKTIAVLGSGIDEKTIYPKENLNLAKRIIEAGGAVVSEFPSETPAFNYNFPKRNRIISGLSDAVLVIEAKQKSGALITANFAFSQNRKVFAVPGSVYSLNSQGPHNLIKKGAKLTTVAGDIMEELDFSFLTAKIQQRAEAKTLEEELILNALKNGPLHIDKIIKTTKINTAKVNSTLAIMEINNQVKNLEGSVFVLTRRQ